MAAKGHGKRGRARVIYYSMSKSPIGWLLVYPKNEKDDLTVAQCKALKTLVETWR